MPLDWKRQDAYCRDHGDTPDAIDKRIRSGLWLDGVHVRVPAGSKQRWINLSAAQDWILGEKPPHLHGSDAR